MQSYWSKNTMYNQKEISFTASVAILGPYTLLNRKPQHWHWRIMGGGGHVPPPSLEKMLDRIKMTPFQSGSLPSLLNKIIGL
jgi:hypothetical protein